MHAPKSASKAYQSQLSVMYSGRISADWISNSHQLVSQDRVNQALTLGSELVVP